MYVENRATKAERVKLVSKKEHSECMSNESISLYRDAQSECHSF